MTDYARGFRDGQAAMREACVKIAELCNVTDPDQIIAKALRALPIREPGER